MTVLGQLALTFGLLSIISIGGANATLPEIHRQIVDSLHWMDNATFASLVAIGQAAPGPNVLIVSAIGWKMAGVAGLFVATAAILVPSSCLALLVGRLVVRYSALGWIGLLRASLAPLAVGFMLASGLVMTRAAFQGSLSLVITLVAAASILLTERSPVGLILGGTVAAIVGHHLHVFA